MYAKTGLFFKVKAFFSNWHEFGLKGALSSTYVPQELVVTPGDVNEETKKVFLQLLENNHKNVSILGSASFGQIERSDILKGKHWVKLINHRDVEWKSLSEARAPEWQKVAAIVNGPKKIKA